MNILDLQNQLKNLSQEQLIQQMQAPTGDVPQFLLLSEITRRQKMRTAFEGQQGADQTTVAEDAIAAAGVPAGFAGQMAGAMAPQTDMQGNTGAMPQAPMMPEEHPQMMAGGGIVALRDGGSVQGRPQLIVSGGRQYVQMADGSLIPAELLGIAGDPGDIMSGANIGVGEGGSDRFPTMPEPFAPALAGGMDSAPVISGVPQAAMPSRLPPLATIFDENDIRGVNPSFRELEEGAFPEGSPAMPLSGFAQPLSVGRPPVDPARAQAAADDLFSVIGGVIRPPLEALDQSAVGQYRTPSLTSMLPQFMQDRIAGADVGAMPMDFGVAGEGFPVDSISGAPAVAGEFQGPPMPPPARDPAQAELDALIAGSPPADGARPFDRLFAGIGEGARAVVDNFRAPEGGYDFDPNLGYMMGAEPPVTEDTVAPTDPQAVAEAEALAAAQAAGQSGGAAGAAGPSGGGIAALSGAAAASPSQFEQELLDMMAAREKRAEQDKWLSLAQFGLQLMSSKEPTLGGAIGEAGAPALETLRSGRESSEADRLGMLNMLEQYRMGQAQLALSQQAAAARAAAGSGGGGWGGLLTPLQELQGAERAIGIAQTALENARTSGDRGAALDAANQLEAAQRRYQEIAGALSIFGAGPQGGPGAMFDVR
jgi:hypothetical protein